MAPQNETDDEPDEPIARTRQPRPHRCPQTSMTKSQESHLRMYQAARDVCRRNMLPLACLPVARKGFADFEAALKALEQLLTTAPDADASPRAHDDFKDLVAAGFRAVDCMLKERLDIHMDFFAGTAPQFFGAFRTVRMQVKKRAAGL
jgi:hypothetical protein